MKGLIALLILVAGLTPVATFSQVDLYIGTYTSSGSYGIYLAKFDLNQGTIKVTDSIAADNPSYLAVNKAGNRIYSVTENGGSKKGAVSSFFKDEATGKWSKLNPEPVPSGGDHPCYISLDSKARFAVVSNYTGGSLAVLPIDAAGMLGQPVQMLQQYGSSVNSNRQKSPHVHSAIFSPNEKYVVMADLGTDMVKAFPFNPKKATPLDTTKVIALKASPGSGPRHLVFHPKLKLFYVMGELSGKVSVHGFNKKRIALLQTIRADTVSQQPGSADIHVSPDGAFLYASNRADANNLAVYKIDPNDGRLTPVGLQSTMGIQPRNFTIDPTGKFLLAANQASNTVVVFAIDATTGMPKPTGFQLRLPSPVCLVFGGQ